MGLSRRATQIRCSCANNMAMIVGLIDFQDFPVLENATIEFQDFPGYKMVVVSGQVVGQMS